MPTYLYRCVTCSTQAEVVQPFTDPTLERMECTTCGSEQPVKKVFTPVGVAFKGSGFYKTDSRSGSNGGSGKADGAAEAKGEAKTEPKTAEAKSADPAPVKASDGAASSGPSAASAPAAAAKPA